ncbi:MAG: hypothetical protein ACMVY4_15340 [Minwuia sp.]|uniref:hypothetical protein n=1 Tax=Minwuia sp. TaxID=2493630 RepID=UPI003A87F0E5
MDPTEFILPIGGILLIVVLVWVTGGSRGKPVDRDAVSAALAADGHEAAAIEISRDGRAAVAWIDGMDRMAVVRAMGDDTGVTLLSSGDIRQLKLDGGDNELHIRFRSFGQPPLTLRFTDETALEKWRKALMLYAELEG